MAIESTAYVPSMSDEAVNSRTGRDWTSCFKLLDRAGAAKLEHGAIVKLLSDKHAVPRWWRQMVTVEYERARGLRMPHQRSHGYCIAVSKTLGTNRSKLYGATVDARTRTKWFPQGSFELSTQTTDQYFRGACNQAARLEIGFFAKGIDKAQLAVQVSKLGGAADVERERAAWQRALRKLQKLLEQ